MCPSEVFANVRVETDGAAVDADGLGCRQAVLSRYDPLVFVVLVPQVSAPPAATVSRQKV